MSGLSSAKVYHLYCEWLCCFHGHMRCGPLPRSKTKSHRPKVMCAACGVAPCYPSQPLTVIMPAEKLHCRARVDHCQAGDGVHGGCLWCLARLLLRSHDSRCDGVAHSILMHIWFPFFDFVQVGQESAVARSRYGFWFAVGTAKALAGNR